MSSRAWLMLAVLVALVCGLTIARIQPALAGELRQVRLREDVSALPPARELRVLTFGYRAAGADLAWAALVVEQGVRTAEKRPFPAVTRYVDAVIELDPKHPSIYKFVDSLIIYKPVGVANADDARTVRAYLERGTRERPYEHDVWLQYGQFLAFLAPSILTDPVEIEAWRRDGAFAIAQAIELGASADRSLAVSSLLGRAGERKAQIQLLQTRSPTTKTHATRSG